MNNLSIVCPDIDKLTIAEIMEYVTDCEQVPSREKRKRLIEIIYQVLGYNLEPDLLLFLLDESKRILGLAPAGGGKTTAINVKLILQKLYRKSSIREGKISGDHILSLVYNRENVKDIQNRHRELVYKLKSSGLGEIKAIRDMDDFIQVSTFHGFCRDMIITYQSRCGVVGYKEMSDESKSHLMTMAVKAQIKKFNYTDLDISNISMPKLLNVYNYMREAMLTSNELNSISMFSDLGLDIDFVTACFTTYDSVKKRKKQYDYTDMLTIFWNLLSENEDVRERIADAYEFITADEVQDTTKIISCILEMLSRKSPLICIGDDDQSIYQFRGADNQTIVNFSEIFKDGKVFLLKTNRRCPRNVISMATTLINTNVNRYSKEIRAINPDGNITFQGYSDRKGELISIVERIKDMSEQERKDTCICYRNRNSSRNLSTMLLNEGISFHTLSGVKPYTHNLYKICFDILDALTYCNNKELLFNLYKCLPVKRDEMADALRWDPEKGKPTDGEYIMWISDINFISKIDNQRFQTDMALLIKISECMHKVPLNTYFPNLFNMILRYYWEYQVKVRGLDIEEDIDFRKEVFAYFNINKPYKEMKINHDSCVKIMNMDERDRQGVCLSTFHSLKGLEFKNVIIIDLQESIFPNITMIENKPYSDEAKQSLIECETRLFYVAITRTKKNLIMYYNKSDPSYYITLLINSEDNAKEANTIESNDSNLISLDEILIEDEPKVVPNVVIMDEDNNSESLEDLKSKERKIAIDSEEPQITIPKTNDFRNKLLGRFF